MPSGMDAASECGPQEDKNRGHMKALLAFALFTALICMALGIFKAKRGGASQGYQFARKAPFLRDDEIHLYERLVIALRDAHVFPQVAMSAFVQHKGKEYGARSLFSQKYVDYLVCERGTMRPLYVIELDGASHGGAQAKKRDRQKNQVLQSAGIPIKRYSSKDIDFKVILADFSSVIKSAESVGTTISHRGSPSGNTPGRKEPRPSC
jgi:hypothetical protein